MDDQPTPTTRAALPKDAGRVCPYCRFALKQGTEVIECGGCHAPHHTDCWGDNGGCALLGCSGGPGAAGAAAPDPPPAADVALTQTATPPPASDAPTRVQTPAAGVFPPAQTQAPPPQMPPTPPQSGRGSPALVVAVLVLALAIAGGAAAMVITSKKDHRRTAAVVPQESPAPTPPDTSAEAGDAAAAAAPDIETTVATGVLPDEDQTTMAADIQSVLLEHHSAIVAGDYSRAWDLTSKRYQAKKLREDGYDAWETAQRSLTPYLEPDGLEVSIQDVDPRTGVATIGVTGMGWTKGDSPCSTWSGTTWARYEDGAWRYEPGYSMTPRRRAEWEPRRAELLGWGC